MSFEQPISNAQFSTWINPYDLPLKPQQERVACRAAAGRRVPPAASFNVLPRGFHKVRYYGLWNPSKREQSYCAGCS